MYFLISVSVNKTGVSLPWTEALVCMCACEEQIYENVQWKNDNIQKNIWKIILFERFINYILLSEINKFVRVQKITSPLNKTIVHQISSLIQWNQ